MFRKIKTDISKSYPIEKLKEKLGYCETASVLDISGVNGSLVSLIIDFIYTYGKKKIFYITGDDEQGNKTASDLELINNSINLSFYSSAKNIDSEEFTKTLSNLSENLEYVIIAGERDLGKEIISKDTFSNSLIRLEKNQEYLFEELIQNLDNFGYYKKDFVETIGDYSVRGGIIDFFPENRDTPLRIEFYGETIESIREFDLNTQRSIREIENVCFGFNLSARDETGVYYDSGSRIKDYLPDDITIIVEEDVANNNEVIDFCKNRFCIILHRGKYISDNSVDFTSLPQPDFGSNIKAFIKNCFSFLNNNFAVYLLCSDDYQLKRMRSLIEELEDEVSEEENRTIKISDKLIFSEESLQSGFILPAASICVYTEHQIFGRYFRFSKKQKRKFRGITFEELKELKPGDFVVHRNFGIGIFAGLKKIKIGNNEQEVVKLSYAAGDTVFLNLNYINLITKYSAVEGITPKLTRLGGGEWDKIKERAKKKVKDIARDLILIYAKRKSEKGHIFSPDSHWQRELEAGFMYEDTPDQITATVDVKRDMESETPMDRLICGDVGFGKTEIAVRAAFKAVLDNMQVAVLVPTTILAAQHYNTFRDRLSPFAVEVECISRMQSKKEQEEILNKLEEGKVDILIGTHRILSKDIRFKSLGLLVIDEEQRFGVKAKEKLRALKPNVDTLTLTATPIPRTLNFSLLGARDLSVINTPPKNRKPIITEIINFNLDYISEAISNELNRGGQVYFVNDKISGLYDLAEKIISKIPKVKAGIAHGQMNVSELEDVVVDFIEKKTNVLFCTKIIESGLDIPNVNTIIINNANMYGLSELYQLRGRVGRSDVQAYAYLISPPAGKLTKTAVRRLQAIEEYTELGSGFNLAMRDMEIRGVGNLLGKEQSGFVNQLGFEMFIDIIDEAVSELKENEFSEIFKEEKSLKKISEKIKKKEDEVLTILENDFDALIPDDYIGNDVERLNLYKRLFDAKDKQKVSEIENELTDRFGKYNEKVKNLFEVIRLKLSASRIGLEKITVSGREAVFYFPEDKEHRIYKSKFFDSLIQKMSSDRSGKYEIDNDKKRLVLNVTLDDDDDKNRLKELYNLLSSD